MGTTSRPLLISPPQVLDLPPTDGSPIDEHIDATFLDEFLMIVWTTECAWWPVFTIFDTTFPVASRRFRVPRRYCDQSLIIHVDHDRHLGMLDRDRPLTTDPTQAIFIVELGGQSLRPWIIVRIQTLAKHIRSAVADSCVPWDVWGRGAVVMEGCTWDDGDPSVHGVRVTTAKGSTTPVVDRSNSYLCSFDFSLWGQSILPLCDGGEGIERRAAFGDGRDLLIQGNRWMNRRTLDTLGDSRFMQMVSRFRCWRSD